jgi:hypothetical protein
MCAPSHSSESLLQILVMEKVPPKAILVTCAVSCEDRPGSDSLRIPICPERTKHYLKRVIHPVNLMSRLRSISLLENEDVQLLQSMLGIFYPFNWLSVC